MKLQNRVMLITYPDSMGHNLKDLNSVLENYLRGVIGGLHILPFFPSAGDRGFSPMTCDKVGDQFDDWSDIEALSSKYYTMSNFMINHLSKHSEYYKDFVKNEDKNEYKNLYLNWDRFWPENRPTQADINLICKHKDCAPYQTIEFADGGKTNIWNTFGENQPDLDIRTGTTKKFVKDNLVNLASHGAGLIRLDAFAYAIKRLDTNDFFVEPEIWGLLKEANDDLKGTDAQLLPEVHGHYKYPFKVSEHGYFIYDFVLPMVLLYSLYNGKSKRLADWLCRNPTEQFITLDIHDGLGVVDAEDILSDDEVNMATNESYKVGVNAKRKYSSAEYHDLDIYQINTTYYSVLGDDDEKYFISHLVQVFAPGIPQAYYVRLFADQNDLKLLEETKEGRNINRHYYEVDGIADEVKRPVVAKLFNLLRFRDEEEAFDLEDSIGITTPSESQAQIVRENKDKTRKAVLNLDLAGLKYNVEVNGKSIDFNWSLFTLIIPTV